MKAEEWVKKHYSPVKPADIALPYRAAPRCVLIDDQWYEVSYGDYQHYIDLKIKDEQELKKEKDGN